MKGFVGMGMTFLIWVSGIHADIIITEVAMKAKPDWIEIHNSGSKRIDISGFVLTDLDGTDTPFASQTTTLSPKAYAVIHWSEGTDETDNIGDIYPPNGYIDLYVNDKSLTGTDDQAVLFNGMDTVDAVVWSNNDGGGSAGELNDFNDLAPKWWNYPDIDDWTAFDSSAWIDSDDISEMESLVRYLTVDTTYMDTNRKTDWCKASRPMPGRQNNQIVSVSTQNHYQPTFFCLLQNYPNPFNTTTRIQYSVISDQAPHHVTLRIYNILGQKMKTLNDEPKEIGTYSVLWDGVDACGKYVSSGIYFYKLTMDGGQWAESKKMILLR